MALLLKTKLGSLFKFLLLLYIYEYEVADC